VAVFLLPVQARFRDSEWKDPDPQITGDPLRILREDLGNLGGKIRGNHHEKFKGLEPICIDGSRQTGGSRARDREQGENLNDESCVWSFPGVLNGSPQIQGKMPPCR